MTPVLGDLDRDHGQLLHLPAHRLAHRDVLAHSEDVSTTTAIGPMLDHLIHRPRGQQRTPPAFVTGLSALFAPRCILAALRRGGRRIGARGNGRVARAAVQSALKLSDALILAGDPRGQRLDLDIHPQQHLHDRLTTSVINRFRLNPLHTKRFDTPRSCPPTH
jgi:hypothetical protein